MAILGVTATHQRQDGNNLLRVAQEREAQRGRMRRERCLKLNEERQTKMCWVNLKNILKQRENKKYYLSLYLSYRAHPSIDVHCNLTAKIFRYGSTAVAQYL